MRLRFPDPTTGREVVVAGTFQRVEASAQHQRPAVLRLPVLVPLSDLIGLSRQTVLAYQFGAGLCELITPANGALMATLAAAGVPL